METKTVDLRHLQRTAYYIGRRLNKSKSGLLKIVPMEALISEARREYGN